MWLDVFKKYGKENCEERKAKNNDCMNEQQELGKQKVRRGLIKGKLQVRHVTQEEEDS